MLVGAGGAFYVLWSKLAAISAPGAPGAAGTAAAKNADDLGPLFPLESFIVNLADQGGKRYLRVTMNLELTGAAVTEALTKRIPQVRDIILVTLSTKKYEDIQNVEGKNFLRDEITTQINTLLATEAIKKIFFSEFVIQ
jgi:flagellar FliL protein